MHGLSFLFRPNIIVQDIIVQDIIVQDMVLLHYQESPPNIALFPGLCDTFWSHSYTDKRNL